MRHPTIERVGQQIGCSYQHGVSALLYTYVERELLKRRNRYRACEVAQVEPEFQQRDGHGSLVMLEKSQRSINLQSTPKLGNNDSWKDNVVEFEME